MKRQFLAVVVASVLSAAPAVAQWVEWPVSAGGNGNLYRLSSSVGSWHDAQAEALADGAYLVTINSEQENDWLFTVFGSVNIPPPENGALWIGLRRVGAGWEWETGESLTYENWAAGEPNNFEGDEDFGWMYSETYPAGAGQWNDAPSPDSRYNFKGIIERPNPNIPAVSTWGLVVLCIAGLSAGAVILRRKRQPLHS